MAAELSNLHLSLTQTQEHRVLGVVLVAYGYELFNRPTPGVKDSGAEFACVVDIIGDDVISDDLLASRVDAHSTACPPDESRSVTREFVVAQGILDEDIGDDEIKLQVRISRAKEPEITAITPIVKGKF